MKIFLSYGHDTNAPLVKRIKDDLAAQGHEVWIDTAEIKSGDDWRRSITDGILKSDGVLAFLSAYSVRDPGVCRDELTYAYTKAHIIERSDDLLVIKGDNSDRTSDVMAWLDKGVIPEDYAKRMEYFFKDNKFPVLHVIEATKTH